jgi:hypothetical protein
MSTQNPSLATPASWTTRLLWLLAVLLCCGSAYYLGKSLTGKRDGTPVRNEGLVIEERYLDFGEAWEEKSFRWKLPIQNPTSRDLEVTALQSNCACSSVEPSSVTIPAGAEREVTLTINLTRDDKAGDDKPRGFELGIVPLIAGAPPNQQGWTLRGRVRPVLTLTPARVLLDRPLVQGQSPPSARVLVKAHTPLSGLSAAPTSAAASTEVRKVAGQERSFELLITLRDGFSPGPVRFEVVLEPKGQDGLALPPVRLSVSGMVLQDLQVQPPALLLGAKAVGEVARETFTLRSEGAHPFMVEKVEGVPDGVTLSGQPQGETAVVYQLEKRIVQPGEQSFPIRFVVRKRDGATESVTLQVVCLGIPGPAR